MVDHKLIPLERELRNAVTCSVECARVLRQRRRSLADTRKCRHCGRPSSGEERKEFLKWRRETQQFKKRGRPKKAAGEATETIKLDKEKH